LDYIGKNNYLDMNRFYLLALLLCFSIVVYGQSSLGQLTVEKIMRDPKWIGTSPNTISWSPESKTLFFNWNPENYVSDSLYSITIQNLTPKKISYTERKNLPSQIIRYNKTYTKGTYEKNGDIYLYDINSKVIRQITNTVEREIAPYFSGDDNKIIFSARQNAYSWDIMSGQVSQLTDFRSGKKSTTTMTDQERWLKKDQLAYFEVLKQRDAKQQEKKKITKAQQPHRPKEIYVDDKIVELLQVSPDEKFISYNLSKNSNAKGTIVPNYVTASGFTEDISARAKVGAPLNATDLYIYDIAHDTTILVLTDNIPGIRDSLAYLNDYPKQNKKKTQRSVNFGPLVWSDDGTQCIVSIYSLDFKDRWIMKLDVASQELSLLYREHDDAWVGSPLNGGFGNNSIGWLSDNKRIWFTSEETGYSHLYTLDVTTKSKQSITAGKYEVQQVALPRSKQFFYIVTNEIHPGEKQLYRVPVSGGKAERLTTAPGAHEFVLSPDEKMIALRYSYANRPWELYLMENKPGSKMRQVTYSLSDEFKSYQWRDPEVISFKARDNNSVYARLYKPQVPNGAAVIFVHGAGYLQNAHKWWSSYFREYMFHNLLADRGYTVMDIDYRASSGYGRDWRTSIYRHMGGKDLTDNVDGAKYLVEKLNIDAQRIGIYGGSYGGFITLMAMFTTPDVFAAGAALRPVTDWAHYNQGYTGSILNIPYLDSLAYAKSSPLYYAEGLKGALLMCHGMVDTNVHFQDAVRLSQRLIELEKDNWELAVYPMEDHAFVEASSWTDEYKRILKLFEQHLKPKPTAKE
jgi:dipeptidyl aminopeptidase/acylaminoacyl peptidase